MSLALNRSAWIVGTLTGFAIAAPAAAATLIFQPAVNGQIALYSALLAGLVLGGWRGGLRSRSAPLTHGALCGLGAFFLLEVTLLIVGQINGRPWPPVGPVVFNSVMALCAGIFGGFLASFRTPKPPEAPSPDPPPP